MVVFTACDCIEGQGPVIDRKIQMENVSGLILDISGDVVIDKGLNSEISISGQENILDVLDFEKHNGILRIKSNVPCITRSDIDVHLYVDDLQKLQLRGSGTIRCNGEFLADDLDIEIDGSGEIFLNTDANEINIRINGSGDVYLDGQTDELDIQVNGSGRLKAEGLEAEDCEVVINGSGDCWLNIEDKLNVTVRGSGDVIYQGNPDINTRISGSGSVKRK
jgi:hypothetical protein